MLKHMQQSRLQSRAMVTAIFLALLTAAGGLWWISTRSDVIAFLPVKPDAMARRAAPIRAVFRHTFTLDAPPASATLAAVCTEAGRFDGAIATAQK
jgi:hypothetical protein